MSTFKDYLARETLHEEFIDGRSQVNPPNKRHVRVARRLTRVLEDACPTGYEVLPEFGLLVAPRTVLEPDIMVAEEDAPDPDLLTIRPLLVVEVTSPSTKAMDWGRKRQLYAAAGVQFYWIVSPDEQSFWVMDGDLSVPELLPGGVQTILAPFQVTINIDELFA